MMDRRMFLKLSAAIAAGAAMPGCAPASARLVRPQAPVLPTEKLLLKNCHIVDVKQGRLRRETDILIENGKITGMFDGGQPGTAVAAEKVMDLGGAFVMPGLINAHCHMSLPGAVALTPYLFLALGRQLERGAEECIAHGVTTVRDMLAEGNFLTTLKNKISRGDVVGPRILSCCALDIRGGYGDEMNFLPNRRYFRVTNNPAQAREEVKAAVDSGVDFIKIFQQTSQLIMPGKRLEVMDTDTMTAICSEAARHGKRVAMHHTQVGALIKGLVAGVESYEHIPADALVSERDLRMLLDRGCIAVPTASVCFFLSNPMPNDPSWGKGWTPVIERERPAILQKMVKEYTEPGLVEGTLALAKKYADPGSYATPHLVPWPCPTTVNAQAVVGVENLRRLYEAGVCLGCGNDGGIPFVFSGAVNFEMQLWETLGAKTADILRMATANNAKLMQMEDQIGTVQTGKIADLAVFDKNPLETVTNLDRARLVFQAGRLTYRARA